MVAPGLSATLADWLTYLEVLHPKTIALGLDRVHEVRQRLGLDFACPVITVGGTNGKGSTVAMLESILRCAGYRVGCYSSPHLLRFNERVRVAGVEASDAELVAAFTEIEAARGTTQLTYFEFSTLAAAWLFVAQQVDVAVLEVGLGGRLDAVNAFNPDCSVLTNVALDHMDYLGETREDIGREKAGIFRPGKPVICTDPIPPRSVLEAAIVLGADLRLIGRDFGFEANPQQWNWWGRKFRRHSLAHPALRGANQLVNASGALAALEAVADMLPVGMQEIRDGLAELQLAGRFQIVPGRPIIVLDVAHNPHAAAVLAGNLDAQGFFPQTSAVFGMLADKDIAGVVKILLKRIDRWYCGTLPGPRGAQSQHLAEILAAEGAGDVRCDSTLASAYQAARGDVAENDRIVVFGSFLTVAEVASFLTPSRTGSKMTAVFTPPPKHGR